MPDYDIIPLAADHLEQVLKLSQSVNLEWTLAHFEAALSSTYPLNLGMFECKHDHQMKDKRLVGFIISTVNAEEADLELIAIEPSKQNKGLGRYLLDSYIYSLEFQGVNTLNLEVANRNPALHFYKKNKFELLYTRRNYYKNGDDALILQRRLTNDTAN